MARSTASPIIPLSRDSRFFNPANPREGPKVLSVVVGSGRSGTPAPRTPGELLPSYASCRADRNGCGDPFFHSFRTLFSPAAAKGLAARYDLRPRDDRFRAEVDRGATGRAARDGVSAGHGGHDRFQYARPILHSGHSTRCAGWPETSGSETPEGY